MKFKYLLFFSLLVASLQAASISDLTFTLINGGTASSVSDCDQSASGILDIPNNYAGLPVTSIGSQAFQFCNSLTSITIPDSVTSIESNAFDGCTSLTSVTFEGDAPTIGNNAFIGSNLVTVYYDSHYSGWSNSVAGRTAVQTNTLTYTLNGDSTEYSVSDCVRSASGSLEIPNTYNGLPVSSISLNAFSGRGYLTSITIPDSVTSIGDSAFKDCSGLTSITIPDGVTSIGDSAFYNCSNLTSITIPESVTSIGDSAFYNCSGLTSITIPDSVTSIGDYGFAECDSLTSITIPDSVTSIGTQAFYSCSTMDMVILSTSVTTIEDGTFQSCTNLSSVNIPDGVTSIGQYAFWNCTDLTNIVIPNSVTSIGQSAFYNCRNISLLTLTNSINTIEESTFQSCVRLFSISIPDSVVSIGESAFEGCANLTDLTIPDNVTTIGTEAFHDCDNLTSITIGKAVNSIGYQAFYGNTYNLGSITCLANIAPATYGNTFSGGPGVLVTGNLITYGNTWAGQSVIPKWGYTIVDGTVTLTTAAQDENVVIPSTLEGYPVTKIGDDSSGSIFGSSSSYVLSIVLPSTLTSISSNAFIGCTSLNSIKSQASTAPTLGFNAFVNVPATEILVPTSSGQSYLDKGDGSTYGGLQVTYVENQSAYNAVFNQIRSTGQQDVVNDPAAYNLATADEVSTATSNARSTGQQDVVNDPTSFGLYDESSILDLNVTTPTISMLGEDNDALVEFTIEISEDLQNWSTSEVIQRTMAGLGEKFFVRLQAGEPYVEPYIEPDVVVYEHPTLGNILTTQSGQVLYRFTIDNNGANPVYIGTSWPLVSASDAPVVDSDVSSTLGSATFSNAPGGPYLTVNGYPVYTFTNDTELGQATGQNSGTVWFTIKPDGTLNQ